MPNQTYDEERLKELVEGIKTRSKLLARIEEACQKDEYFKNRPGTSRPAIMKALKHRGLLKDLEMDTRGVTCAWSDEKKESFRKDFKNEPIKELVKKYGLKDQRQAWNLANTLSAKRGSKLPASLKKEPDVVNQKEWIKYFSGSKTVKEASRRFKVSARKIKERLKQPIEHYKLYIHHHRFGAEELYIYLPEIKKGEVALKPRIWNYLMEKTGKPGVVINFPSDIGWRKRERKRKNEKEKMRIVPLSDVWLRHPLHDGDNFDERLNWIAREAHVFSFLNGDILYPHIYASKKEDRTSEFALRLEELKAKLLPISHKILWAQAGCFEEKFANMAGLFDPIEHICKEWNIPYFKTPCSNVISWKGNLFFFFCIHGRSTAQKRGAKFNAAVRPLEFNEFTHFFVMSHIRDKKNKKVRRVIRTINDLTLDNKQYVAICPSFVRYDESREAKWGYIPPSRGQMNFALYADSDYHLYVSPQQEFEEIVIPEGY